MNEKIEQIRNWVISHQKRLASIGVGTLAILMAYHVVMAENGIRVYFHKRSENSALKSEIERLRAEHETLSKRVSALKTDPQTIEKEAREQLKYTRPGEVVFVTPEKQEQAPSNATAQKR